QQIVYRGTDGYLHEIRWSLPAANAPAPIPTTPPPPPPPPPSGGGGGGSKGGGNNGGKPTQMQ
ncbi:MAG: hypothetical protein HOO92_15570, partial [Methylococcaceae bacterium]|nr:hypothetical protein [Methylococcaceae bacterium]